jgi:hypothetical protein
MIYIIKCVLENLNVIGAVKEKIVYKSLFFVNGMVYISVILAMIINYKI